MLGDVLRLHASREQTPSMWPHVCLPPNPHSERNQRRVAVARKPMEIAGFDEQVRPRLWERHIHAAAHIERSGVAGDRPEDLFDGHQRWSDVAPPRIEYERLS